MLVKDSSSYTNNHDILVGGTLVKTETTSQGFLMRLSYDGRIRWQRNFNSDDANADSITLVDTFEQISYAVTTTFTGSEWSFFIVKLDEGGNIIKNVRIGDFQDSYTYTTLSARNLVLHDQDFVSVAFNGDTNDFFAFKNLTSDEDEFLIGFSDESAENIHFLTGLWTEAGNITAYAILRDTLHALNIDPVRGRSDALAIDQSGFLAVDEETILHDVSYSDNLDYVFIAFQGNADPGRQIVVYGSPVGPGLPDPTNIVLQALVGMGRTFTLSIYAKDDPAFYLSFGDTSGTVFIVFADLNSGESTLKGFKGVDNREIVSTLISNSKTMFAASRTGAGDGSLTAHQILIFQSEDCLGESESTISEWVTGVTVSATNVIFWPQMKVQVTAVELGNDGSFVPTSYPLSPSSILTDANGDYCFPQPIIIEGFPEDGDEFCYDLTANREVQSWDISASQCQDLPFTYSITDQLESTPDWMSLDLSGNKLNITLASVDEAEEGQYDISIVLELVGNPDANNASRFRVNMYEEPAVFPTSQGTLASTSVEEGNFAAFNVFR